MEDKGREAWKEGNLAAMYVTAMFDHKHVCTMIDNHAHYTRDDFHTLWCKRTHYLRIIK